MWRYENLPSTGLIRSGYIWGGRLVRVRREVVDPGLGICSLAMAEAIVDATYPRMSAAEAVAFRAAVVDLNVAYLVGLSA